MKDALNAILNSDPRSKACERNLSRRTWRFLPIFEIFEGFFRLRPPYKGSQPLYEATPLTRGRVGDLFTSDSLMKGS